MRTNKTKEQFIQRLNKEIELNKELLSFYYNVYLPTLQKFNGKVYNKRFINALNEQVTNELMFIRDRKNNEIVIELRFEKHNYSDYQLIYCLLLVDDDYRIDFEKTTNDKIGNAWIENIKTSNIEMQNVINDYDSYLDVAKECQEMIEKYANLPYQIRENIRLDKIWYLK